MPYDIGKNCEKETISPIRRARGIPALRNRILAVILKRPIPCDVGRKKKMPATTTTWITSNIIEYIVT
ncbi:hypothetical protein QE152_g9681 [Popillia japonica]|uniref:Uncharacterized protein n=1 Tax=Popillia japonica TaxID=7064 RepID=A0AAW1LWT3_POPJA